VEACVGRSLVQAKQVRSAFRGRLGVVSGKKMDWQPPPEIEKLLDPGSIGSADDWRRLKDYLTRSFAAYLGQEIEPVWEPICEDISPGRGFAFGIRSGPPLGGPLALEWYGVISHGPGQTRAVVLLFAQDQRVIPIQGREYLAYQFCTTTGGLREWESRGWSTSEMGDEWAGYRRLSEVCREMSRTQESR